MEADIKNNLSNPKQLEYLYRRNKTLFKKAFDKAYPEVQNNLTAQIWKERLDYGHNEIYWGTKNEILIVIIISLIAGLIAKIPDFTGINPEYFYTRNISFVVLPALTAYFIWKYTLQLKKILIISAILFLSAVYINILPNNYLSDTLILASIHMSLFLWAVLGFAFAGEKYHSYQKRIEFLRYNGDLIVITTVLLIAGGILSGVAIALFGLIDIQIEEFYFTNIAIWGLAAIPVLGTFFVQTNPHLVKNVSYIIAKVFSPLVLIMLVVYLGAIIFIGKDPFIDRNFLILFNILLIGVTALILFSIAEGTKDEENKIGVVLLFMLSFVTIIVNGIALSAIIFRISEWGITPNRLAVFGGNLLILINLAIITYRLFKSVKKADEIVNIENSIAAFLPIYVVWAVVVAFLFPIIFGFK